MAERIYSLNQLFVESCDSPQYTGRREWLSHLPGSPGKKHKHLTQ